MPIEVRQMTIRSHVVPSSTGDHHPLSSREELEALKEEIRAECRRMIVELLQEQRER